MLNVSFITENRTVQVPPGTTLLQAEIAAGLQPDAPCGGRGACGKCAVDVLSDSGERVTVLACAALVQRDIRVVTSGRAENIRILTEGTGRIERIAPPVKAAEITIRKAAPAAPASLWRRVGDAVEAALGVRPRPDPAMANGLAAALEALDDRAQAVLYGDELLALRGKGRLLTAAVDIGTTSVVLYLADGVSGERLSAVSMLNPQAAFGADVISRANYALQNGVGRLSDAIRRAVNELLSRALDAVGCRREDVFSLVVAGNTCMHHLFLGLDPKSLVVSPYVPSITDPLVLNAADFGIAASPRAKLFLLPCIAGFVGADTAAVMLSCGFDRREALTLAVDIGTNGEIVLGDRRRMAACSTAAGPAFEGAHIACGMRGAEGAVDHAEYRDGRIRYTVMGQGKPRGLCGSGLMDLTAALLKAGLVDETGRLLDKDELPAGAKALADQVQIIDDQKCFVLAGREECADGRPVYLCQKDIREVQLAKAAMAAGIELMLRHLGKTAAQIENVLLAGAFGSRLSPESAVAIGLLPAELLGRITAVGNAAGQGALMCALDAECLARADRMAEKTEFIELAANAGFQDCFVDHLAFPE